MSENVSEKFGTFVNNLYLCIRNGQTNIRRLLQGKQAYFAYFDRDLGVLTLLALRKMKNHGPYKPYAIIDKFSFEATIGELKKGTPL